MSGRILQAFDITIDKLGPDYSYQSTASLLHILSMVVSTKCGVYNDQIHTIIKHCHELGAEKGEIDCHYELGQIQLDSDNSELAYKHYCFAAQHGHTLSSNKLLKGFTDGHISKEKYAQTLKAYKIAWDSSMCPGRHLALEFTKGYDERAAKKVIIPKFKGTRGNACNGK